MMSMTIDGFPFIFLLSVWVPAVQDSVTGAFICRRVLLICRRARLGHRRPHSLFHPWRHRCRGVGRPSRGPCADCDSTGGEHDRECRRTSAAHDRTSSAAGRDTFGRCDGPDSAPRAERESRGGSHQGRAAGRSSANGRDDCGGGTCE